MGRRLSSGRDDSVFFAAWNEKNAELETLREQLEKERHIRQNLQSEHDNLFRWKQMAEKILDEHQISKPVAVAAAVFATQGSCRRPRLPFLDVETVNRHATCLAHIAEQRDLAPFDRLEKMRRYCRNKPSRLAAVVQILRRPDGLAGDVVELVWNLFNKHSVRRLVVLFVEQDKKLSTNPFGEIEALEPLVETAALTRRGAYQAKIQSGGRFDQFHEFLWDVFGLRTQFLWKQMRYTALSCPAPWGGNTFLDIRATLPLAVLCDEIERRFANKFNRPFDK